MTIPQKSGIGRLHKAILPLCVTSFLLHSSTSAAVVSFGDGVFNLITASGTGDAIIFSEFSDGVTLTFTATNNLVGGNRFLGMQTGNTINGLHLGGGGGSTLEFTVEADQAVNLESYTTSTAGFFLGSPSLSVSGPGVNSTGNSIGTNNIDSVFAAGPLALQAGETYTFSASPTGAGIQAFVSSFTITAVPEPSSLVVLALAGILGCSQRRRTYPA